VVYVGWVAVDVTAAIGETWCVSSDLHFLAPSFILGAGIVIIT
jgi:hypothetical protein